MPADPDVKLRFRSSIRRGTGEAYLLIRKYAHADFSDEIIKACLKNFAYDGQCESSRADYLFELILLSHTTRIRAKILHALATEQNHTWTLTQLFDLAKLFAQQGDEQARQAIYGRFFTNPIDGADWVGYSEIIDLDGLNGLLYIADKLGKGLQTNPDDWQDDTAINYFQQNHPDVDAMQVLKQAAGTNPNIQRYLNNVEQTATAKPAKNKPVYHNIVDEVLQSSRRFLKKEVSNADLNLLAQQLLTEKNITNKEKLLFVFTKFRFPLNYSFILDIARKTLSRNKYLADMAIQALSLLQGEEIREFCLAEVDKAKQPANLLRILRSNYKEGDHKTLTRFAQAAVSNDDIEWLAIGYADIYQTNKTPECREPLEAIYNKLTCAIHRYDVVKILMDNNALPDEIRQEMEFDCNHEIRKLARHLKN